MEMKHLMDATLKAFIADDVRAVCCSSCRWGWDGSVCLCDWPTCVVTAAVLMVVAMMILDGVALSIALSLSLYLFSLSP
jgi:hypothetical protein